jgi:hypothetical protein
VSEYDEQDELARLLDIARRFTPVDWGEAWDAKPDEVHWLIEPIIEVGQSVSLLAVPGVGKSLLALEWAAALATGRRVLGNPARDPVTVVYVDIENRECDLVERLQDMGYKPGDLDRLITYSFPSLAVLDSSAGAEQILALAVTNAALIVFVDTASRVVAGNENDADTWQAVYRHTVLPLRKRGIAMLRLDHLGKDAARGARGSSAKKDDVDAEWLLTEVDKGKQYTIAQPKRRTNHGDAELTVRRLTEPLRHVLVSGSGDRIGEIVAELDLLRVPRNAGRPTAEIALKNAGIQVRTTDLAAAVKRRKCGVPKITTPEQLPNLFPEPGTGGTPRPVQSANTQVSGDP